MTGLEGAAFLDETDRIYDETRATCVVHDPDEWPRFLCVESGNIGLRAVSVAPGPVTGSP